MAPHGEKPSEATRSPGLCRTNGVKGQTPVARTTDQRQKTNAISAASAKGEF